jgi:hypothetical protein
MAASPNRGCPCGERPLPKLPRSPLILALRSTRDLPCLPALALASVATGAR